MAKYECGQNDTIAGETDCLGGKADFGKLSKRRLRRAGFCDMLVGKGSVFMKTSKRLVSLLLTLLLIGGAFLLLSNEGARQAAVELLGLPDESDYENTEQDAPERIPIATPGASDAPGETLPDEDGVYTSKEDLALYIHLYGHLPSNFITKQEAQNAGWPGGSLEEYCPGKCIGGDRFGNREGKLPRANGRTWTECDVNTLGADSRGAERIVFSNDGLIFYTPDHYDSFERLY